jgi:hypothetical protein
MILADAALVDRLEFHCRLVGLDLGDDVAGMHLVALFLEPRVSCLRSSSATEAGIQDSRSASPPLALSPIQR